MTTQTISCSDVTGGSYREVMITDSKTGNEISLTIGGDGTLFVFVDNGQGQEQASFDLTKESFDFFLNEVENHLSGE